MAPLRRLNLPFLSLLLLLVLGPVLLSGGGRVLCIDAAGTVKIEPSEMRGECCSASARKETLGTPSGMASGEETGCTDLPLFSQTMLTRAARELVPLQQSDCLWLPINLMPPSAALACGVACHVPPGEAVYQSGQLAQLKSIVIQC